MTNNKKQLSNPLKKFVNKTYTFKSIILSLILSCLVSVGFCYFYFTGSFNFFSESDHLNARDISKLQQVFNAVSTKYIENVPHEDIVDGALSGMIGSTQDPFSDYLTGLDKAKLEESIDGGFEGIGAQIVAEDGHIKIVSPIKDSPAEKAGLKVNDIILSADGNSLSGLTSQEAVNLIRGKAGTEVKLEILRNNKQQTVSIVRDKIPIQTVAYKLLDDNPNIGYIQISEFSDPTYQEMVSALRKLQDKGAKQLILDLRGNPGGLLPSVIQIANIFLNDGDTIVSIEEGNGGKEKIKASSNTNNDYRCNLPLVILVDEGSASASEILAGALQESKGIKLVGHPTYGKGTVQTIYELDSDSELKLTVAKWLTPKGNWIHKKGLTPDMIVDLPEFANLTLINSEKSYKKSDSGDDILNIQKMLVALSYLDEIHLNSQFDDNTVAAIKKLQKEHQIKETGQVDSATSIAMMQDIRNLLKQNDTQLQAAINLLK